MRARPRVRCRVASLIGCRQFRPFFHYLLCHVREKLVYIRARARGSFEKLEAVLTGELLAALCFYYSVGQVDFVGHENFHHVVAGVLLDLLEPICDIVKGDLFRAVVHQYDAHCALVVGLSYGAEALLAGGVPHLQFDSLAIHVDGFNLEVNS